MQFLSHPNRILIEHLKGTGKLMVEFYRPLKNIIKLPMDEDYLKIVGMCHDFGKYTTYFQNYLKGYTKANRLTKHSELGAFFTAYRLIEEGYDDRLVLSAFIAVRNHHSKLKVDVGCDGYDFEDYECEDFKDRMKSWLNDLSKNAKAISKEFGFDISGFLKLETVERIWKKLKKISKKIKANEEIYFTTLYTFSLLTDADKKNASEIPIPKRKHIPTKLIDEYRKQRFGRPKTPMDEKRHLLYEEIMKAFENMDEDIVSITAPTGFGKTLANVSLALRIRDRIYRKKGYVPRIIYALPFTSIIDQTYEVLKEVFESTLEDYAREPEAYLLKHHHLSDISYTIEEEEISLNKALLLVESWESEIIVSTFVQLFESIIGVRNSLLKKFHNIAGSIIILDEIQNIDVKHWNTIRNVFEFLRKNFGCKVILSTATKPMIFDRTYEVVDRRNFQVSRTRIIYRKDVSTVENLGNFVLERLKHRVDSYLVVLNTISSSIALYNSIAEKARKMGYNVFYLSTNVIPIHRLKRINLIKDLLDRREKVILVSTQVVEAGIDLDFDEVVRDLGPLDSIVQVAGRCNRNFRKDIGKVFVVALKDDKGAFLSSRIYGAVLTQQSERILETYREIDENSFHEMVEGYFKNIRNRIAYRDDVWEGIRKLNYDKVEKFRIVESLPTLVDVFVQIDEKAKCIWESFVKLVLEEEDFKKRYLNYLSIRKDLRYYMLSVPKRYAEDLPYKGIYYIPMELVETYYDDETGFIRSMEEFDLW